MRGEADGGPLHGQPADQLEQPGARIDIGADEASSRISISGE
jgi:hypothetical protein